MNYAEATQEQLQSHFNLYKQQLDVKDAKINELQAKLDKIEKKCQFILEIKFDVLGEAKEIMKIIRGKDVNS